MPRFIIGIAYEGFHQDNYRHVYLRSTSPAGEFTEVTFGTGDVVADWNAARAFIAKQGVPESVMVSSSMDGFLMDGRAYYYDEDMGTIERVVED